MWQRIDDCLMCGKDRCFENKDEPGVGYCFRFGVLHRNGKPFIKRGEKPQTKLKREKKSEGNQVGFIFDFMEVKK